MDVTSVMRRAASFFADREAIVHGVDPQQPISEIQTMTDIVDAQTEPMEVEPLEDKTSLTKRMV